MKAIAVLVKVLMLAILHVGAFDLLRRLEALRHLYAVADAAHVDLSGGGALAGVETFGVEDGIELALEFDDIALAERAGDDLHSEFPQLSGERDQCWAQMSGRTILIWRPFASDFRGD